MSRGVARIQLDCVTKTCLGGLPVPVVVELYCSQRCLRLSQRGIELHCPFRRGFSFRCNFTRRNRANYRCPQDSVTVGEPCIRERVVGILFGSRLEVVDRLVESIFMSFAPVIAAFQIVFEGAGVDRTGSCQDSLSCGVSLMRIWLTMAA